MTNVKEFKNKYNGKPIVAFITGGGFSVLDFLKFTGSSKFFYDAVIPYSDEALKSFVYRNGSVTSLPSSCSVEGLEVYKKCLDAYITQCNYSVDVCPVVITAALTTDRFRKGDDRVFFSIGDDEYVFRFFGKMTEKDFQAPDASVSADNYRSLEDQLVSEIILSLLLGDDSALKTFSGLCKIS